MATLTFSVTTGAGTLTRSRDLSAADATRLLNAYKAVYGQIEDPPGSGTFRDRTNQEIVNAIANGFFQGMADLVKRHEEDVAAAAAKAPIAPVVLA